MQKRTTKARTLVSGGACGAPNPVRPTRGAQAGHAPPDLTALAPLATDNGQPAAGETDGKKTKENPDTAAAGRRQRCPGDSLQVRLLRASNRR